MPITTIVYTRQEALAKLDGIFRQLQTDFHDQWDWMDAAFSVEVLRCELEQYDEDRAMIPALVKQTQDQARIIADLRAELRTLKPRGSLSATVDQSQHLNSEKAQAADPSAVD
jgi:hypothetical protein